MKKNIILLLLLMFGICFALYPKKIKNEEMVANVFARSDFAHFSGHIGATGKICDETYDVEEAIHFVRRICDELTWNDLLISAKITDGYVECVCESEDLTRRVSLCQNEEGVYILINQELSDVSDIYAKRNNIENVMERHKLNPNMNMVISGDVMHRMELKYINMWCDAFFRKIDAKVVWAKRDEDIYLLYGYTPYIENYMTVMNKKVNISLSVKYDSDNDITQFVFATPINNMDF